MRLVYDWQFVPSGTDSRGRPGDIQTHRLKDEAFAKKWRQSGGSGNAPNENQRALMLPDDGVSRGFIVVHTGDRGTESPEWFAEPIRAVGRLLAQTRRPALHGRERPLVALPLLGTGAGGAGRRRAGVMQALLDAADWVAREAGIDFVFVLGDKQSYSAAQRIRSDNGLEPWQRHLDDSVVEAAQRLATRARAGNLVVFIGAGLSAAAGLPRWSALLEQLGQRTGLSESQKHELVHELDARDAGAVLQKRLGGERGLDRELRKCFDVDAVPALPHYLPASLPITEAATTTNYDTLFEQAWEAASGEAPAVLPRNDVKSSARWLLKLHGDLEDTRPLVFSRDQYLQLERTSGAIAAVVQAMLLTRHILITGYSLNDETFHRIAYEVRQIGTSAATKHVALSSRGSYSSPRLGTAMLVEPSGLIRDIWQDDLELLALAGDGDALPVAARRQEILLDLVGHLAAPAEAYLLGDRWRELSGPGPDEQLRDTLLGIRDLVKSKKLSRPLHDAARTTLKQFGWTE